MSAADSVIRLGRTAVPLWIAVLLMAATFTAGIVVRGLERPASASFGTSQIVPAPPLTDLDVQLPPGHPPIAPTSGS